MTRASYVKAVIFSTFGLLIFFSCFSESNAFWSSLGKISSTTGKSVCKLGKISGALPEKKISELSGMIQKTGDIKKVGKVLGDMNISNEILEDTYMRIVLKQMKISNKEAEELFLNLRGVSGLRTTLRKVAGVSNAKTLGHLNEIWIANYAKKSGFDVMSIGEKFNDGSKLITDIDVLIKKNGRIFAIEAKKYSNNTNIPIDKFRADMDTLVSYRKKYGDSIIPVFSITTIPKNKKIKNLLEKESKRRGIELIFGSPEEQIILINQLSKIL